MLLRLFLLSLFVPLMLAIPVGMKQLTQGFRLEKMALDFPFHPEWEIEGNASFQIREILSQSYKYLDRGAQCYVFASQDGKYVIKLFRYDQAQNSRRLRPRFFFFQEETQNRFSIKNSPPLQCLQDGL